MKISGLGPLSPPISPERLPVGSVGQLPSSADYTQPRCPQGPGLDPGGRRWPIRTQPFSSSHPIPRREGAPGWAWRAAGGRRSAGTLSSRHLSPAACLTLFASLFPLFLVGVRGTLDYTLSSGKPASQLQPRGQGVRRLARSHLIFC